MYACAGRSEHVLQGPGLDDASCAHDCHAVRDLSDHAEVVGDEEEAHPAPALELLHQAQDLCLHRHVEGGGRLVGDQQLGPAGDRHRDHHPLALAAGEAVGILVHPQLRVLDPHLRQGLDRPAPRLIVADAGAGEPDRLDDLVADGEHRVQRGHRLLEDHRDVPAAHPHQLLLREPQQVARRRVGPGVEPEQDLPVAAFGQVRRQQADHRQGGDGLAAARLADEAEGLARIDMEARAVHRAHRLAVGAEPGVQVPHLEQRPWASSGTRAHRGTVVSAFEPSACAGPWERGRPARPGRRPAMDDSPKAHVCPCGRDARAPRGPHGRLGRSRLAGTGRGLAEPSFTVAASPGTGTGRWRRAAPRRSGCRRTR